MSTKKFTAGQKASFVKMLKGCKKYLWDGVGDYDRRASKFICVCIDYYMQDNVFVDIRHHEALDRHISFLLQGKTVAGFLHDKGLIESYDTLQTLDAICVQQHNITVQQYRLAWVNHLIKEFSV
jgi:hypothetical protein